MLEETGLVVSNNQFLNATNDILPENGKHYVTILKVYEQDNDMIMPNLLEPEKAQRMGVGKVG